LEEEMDFLEEMFELFDFDKRKKSGKKIN